MQGQFLIVGSAVVIAFVIVIVTCYTETLNNQAFSYLIIFLMTEYRNKEVSYDNHYKNVWNEKS